MFNASKLFTISLFALLPIVAQAGYVQGYFRADGTYVQGYYRSDANEYRYDNYNSQTRQTNPYTGNRGYQRDEYSTPPAYNQGRQHRSSDCTYNLYGC